MIRNREGTGKRRTSMRSICSWYYGSGGISRIQDRVGWSGQYGHLAPINGGYVSGHGGGEYDFYDARTVISDDMNSGDGNTSSFVHF